MIKIAVWSIVLNVLFSPLNSSLAVIFGYVTIAASWLYPIIRTFRGRKIKVNKFVIGLAVNLLISMLVSISSIETSMIETYIISFVSFLTFYWSASFRPDETSRLDLRFFFKANLFLCFIYIFHAFGPFGEKYLVTDVWGNKVFNMGLGNPNAVSGYIMFSVMLLLIQLLHEKGTANKFFVLVLMGVMLYILYLLSSRTTFFCTIVALAAVAWNRRERAGNWVYMLVLLIPLCMVFFQLALAELESETQILGKGLDTGRAEIYEIALKKIFSSPLTLLFGECFQQYFQNLHNAPLALIATIGLMGYIPCCVFWFKQIKMLNSSVDGGSQKIAFVCIIVYILHSSAETMFMTGTVPYSMFVLLVLMIAKGDIKYRAGQ